jgi:hypothetical protein
MTMRWYKIWWPHEVKAADVESLLGIILASASTGVELLTTAKAGVVAHYIGLPLGCEARIVRLFTGAIADSTLEALEADPRLPEAQEVRLVRSSNGQRAIGNTEATSKAVHAVLMSSGNARVEVHWHLGRTSPAMRVPNRAHNPGSGSWMNDLIAAPFRAPRELDHEARTALIQKIGQRQVAALGRVAVAALTPDTATNVLRTVEGALHTADQAGVRVVLARLPWHGLSSGKPVVLSASELVALCGWPIGDLARLGLPRPRATLFGPSKSLPTHPTRIWGETTHPENKRHLGLSAEDALRHLHLLGPTGVGKSTLMLNLVMSDIAAGRSTVVVDPKGDLIRDIAARIPEQKLDQLVVIGIEMHGYSVGLNPLRGAHRSEAEGERLSDGLVAVFKGLFADSWGPRTEDILHASLMTLVKRPGTTLVELALLLQNAVFRRSVTATLDDPLVLQPFWGWYESLSEEQRRMVIAPVLNKLRVVLARPSLRRIVGQGVPEFDLTDIFKGQRIVLVSLDQGVFGPEGAALLGALFVAQLWQVTQLAAHRGKTRGQVMVYLDEFQQYVHLPTGLEDVLARSRSYGLGLTLAHQHLHQLPPSMRSALLSNARSRICFQLGSEDAALLAKYSPSVSAQDYMALPLYEVYARLVVNGEATPPVSGRTNSPMPALRTDSSEVVAAAARKFGASNDEIDRLHRSLAEGHGPSSGDAGADVGRRRGRQS